MKNINFSPFAKTIAGKCVWKKYMVFVGGLVFLAFLVTVLRYQKVNFYRGHSDLRQPAEKKEQDLEKKMLPSEKMKTHSGENVAAVSLDRGRENAILDTKENILKSSAPQIDKEEDPPVGYFVKVFSGLVRKDVEKVMAYLVQKDYSPQIIREPGYTFMHNVYVTPGSSLIAGDVINRLKRDGFSVYTRPIKENQCLIRTGSCYYPESAKYILENLKLKGYSGNIIRENTAVKFYSVFIGQYPDKGRVLEEQKKLALMGFGATEMVENLPSSDDTAGWEGRYPENHKE